uniref:Integrase core domain containing protein n=1 Tax=Solanum tuberosum TaxID=4113 RepID=M1DTA4_SOLTU
MEFMMDAKIQVVHGKLDAFELRVLERHAPTIDVTTFQKELVRLFFYVDAHVAPVETVPETAPGVEEDEVVMAVLFGDTMTPPDPFRAAGKYHRSSVQTFDAEEAHQAKKREAGD